MAINNNGYFRVIVSETDGTGASEISTADGTSVIGGGAVHEQEILLENATHAYTAGNRAAVLESAAHGDGATQNKIATTSSGVYVHILHAACTVGKDRQSLTAHVEYVGRARVRITTRAGVQLAVGITSDSPTTHTTDTIALSWTSGETDVLVRVDLKKTDAGSQDGELYSVRVLEDTTSLTGSLDSTAFSKLDSDLVSSTDLRPVDAFVLQAEDGNVREAHAERPRTASVAWPPDHRPILASHREVAIPLFVYPVAHDCASIVVTLYGDADGASSSTAINMRIAVQDVGGRVYDPNRDSPTAVTTSASTQVVTLTFDDVAAVRGQPVTVWLVYVSEDNATEGADDLTPTTTTGAGGINRQGTALTLSSTLAAFIGADERHRIAFSEDSLGTAPEKPQGFPADVMLTRAQGTISDRYFVYPRISRDLYLDYAAIRVTLIKLGTFSICSANIRETHTKPQSQASDFRPAKLPRAVAFRTLYGREYDLAARRERVHHVGGSPRTDVVNKLHGQQTVKISTARTHGQAIVGELPTYRVNTRTATLQYRDRYRILALVAAVGNVPAGNQLTCQVGAELSEFSGGSWGTSSVTRTPDGAAPRVSILPAFQDRATSDAGDLLWLTNHALDGAWPWHEVTSRRDGTVIVEAVVSEQNADLAESVRLMQVTLAGSRLTSHDRAIATGTEIVAVRTILATFTVVADEGF